MEVVEKCLSNFNLIHQNTIEIVGHKKNRCSFFFEISVHPKYLSNILKYILIAQ